MNEEKCDRVVLISCNDGSTEKSKRKRNLLVKEAQHGIRNRVIPVYTSTTKFICIFGMKIFTFVYILSKCNE